MNRNALCWSISSLQVALAIFLWWYAPLQIVGAQKAASDKYPNQKIELGLDFYRSITPAPAEKISLALNFPAAVFAGVLNVLFPKPLYEDKLRFLSARDLAFFGCTGLLWYWLTSLLIPPKSGFAAKNVPSLVRTALFGCGLLFALATGAIAVEAAVSKLSAPPEKQIGIFGMLWAVGLTAYFVLKLKSGWAMRRARRG